MVCDILDRSASDVQYPQRDVDGFHSVCLGYLLGFVIHFCLNTGLAQPLSRTS